MNKKNNNDDASVTALVLVPIASVYHTLYHYTKQSQSLSFRMINPLLSSLLHIFSAEAQTSLTILPLLLLLGICRSSGIPKLGFGSPDSSSSLWMRWVLKECKGGWICGHGVCLPYLSALLETSLYTSAVVCDSVIYFIWKNIYFIILEPTLVDEKMLETMDDGLIVQESKGLCYPIIYIYSRLLIKFTYFSLTHFFGLILLFSFF